MWICQVGQGDGELSVDRLDWTVVLKQSWSSFRFRQQPGLVFLERAVFCGKISRLQVCTRYERAAAFTEDHDGDSIIKNKLDFSQY